jgi:hypothetical protein
MKSSVNAGSISALVGFMNTAGHGWPIRIQGDQGTQIVLSFRTGADLIMCMNKRLLLAGFTGVFILLSGCQTSISYKAADFNSDRTYKHGSHQPQLKETDVLGLKSDDSITDSDIQRILDETRSLKLKPDSTVLLIESGAQNPDKEMLAELGRFFRVIPHTGIPNQISADDSGASLSKALRLAAAQNRAEYVLVYWGNLEMRRDDLPTSIVSWVPVVDFMVPDEYQKVRMSLKVALIEVRTGNWATFRTEPVEGDVVTTRYAREHEMKWPLQGYKQQLYASAAERLKSAYME